MSHVGYWGSPEATAAAWQRGRFHCGDAFQYDDGNCCFVDPAGPKAFRSVDSGLVGRGQALTEIMAKHLAVGSAGPPTPCWFAILQDQALVSEGQGAMDRTAR